MKLLLNCLALLFLFINLSAQEIVLDKAVDEQFKEERGPNMRQYGHFYEGFALVMPYKNFTGAKAEMGSSFEFEFGYRYKLKLLAFYAIGFDISNRWSRYGIKSDVPVIISNPLSQASMADELYLDLSSIGAEVYNRINLGKRGNVLGNYIDIGIKEELNYGRKMILKADAPKEDYYEKSREVQKNLNFVEKFSTLLTARIGINKISIYGNYRFTDLIKSGYTTPELPPLTAGFQVAF